MKNYAEVNGGICASPARRMARRASRGVTDSVTVKILKIKAFFPTKYLHFPKPHIILFSFIRKKRKNLFSPEACFGDIP